MATANISVSGTVAGRRINGSVSIEADGGIDQQDSLPVAKTGTLTTRTSDTVGTFTMDAGHGLTTGQIVNVFWADGSRRKVTLGTVTVNSVPFSLGSGDVLPAQDTAVTVSVQREIDCDFDGDLLKAIGATCPARVMLVFEEADAVVAAFDIPAGQGYFWHHLLDVTNPLAGAVIDKVTISQGDVAQAANFGLGIVYDSTL